MGTTITSPEKILRPDDKGRVGLGSFIKELQRHLGQLSGFAVHIENSRIVLSPRVERDPLAPDTLVLSDADRDAFLEALANPPEPNEALKQAFKKYRDSQSAE